LKRIERFFEKLFALFPAKSMGIMHLRLIKEESNLKDILSSSMIANY
jgi:hypothetical protein